MVVGSDVDSLFHRRRTMAHAMSTLESCFLPFIITAICCMNRYIDHILGHQKCVQIWWVGEIDNYLKILIFVVDVVVC